MPYTYNPAYFSNMTSGNLITGVDTCLTDKAGSFWYILLFTLPVIMVWNKTGSLSVASFVLFWTMGFYGYLMNMDALMGVPIVWFFVFGMVALAFKVLSPTK